MKREKFVVPHGVPEFTDTTAEPWDRDEMMTVSAAAYEIYGEDPTRGKMYAVRSAISRLPVKRQKYVTKWSHIRRWIEKDWAFLDSQTGNNYADPSAVHKPLKAADSPAVEAQAPLPIEAAAPASEGKPKKRQVHWKHDEKERVALAAAGVMLEDPTLSTLNALREAQQRALEPARWRSIITVGNVQDVIDRALALVPTAKRNQERKAREADYESQAQAQAQLARQKQQEAEAAPAPIKTEAVPTPGLADMSYQGLLGLLVQKVMGDFMGELATQIKGQVETQVKRALEGLSEVKTTTTVIAENAVVPNNIHTLKIAPKDRVPRVCVVGLLNQQAEDIKRAFFGSIEFTFVKSQRSGGAGHGGVGMLNAARSCDVVIGMTGFIGHDVENCAKNLTAPYVRINGSVSALKRWVQQWMNGEVALAA